MEQIIEVIPEEVEKQIDIITEPFLLTKTQDKNVELDMSVGDQTIRPDGGYLLQSVTVEKPDTFIPENIKKDVEIAGVVGEYEIHLPTLDNPADDEKVIDGYEYLDGVGAKRTGSFVPPVDTGANGLYKMMIEGPTPSEIIDSGLTELRSYFFEYQTSLVKISFSNVTSIGVAVFENATNLTGILDLPNLVSSDINAFRNGLRRTVVFNVNPAVKIGFNAIRCMHIWIPVSVMGTHQYAFQQTDNVRSVQFDNPLSMDFRSSASRGLRACDAFIIRGDTFVPLVGTANFTFKTGFHFYFPASLLNDHKTATNWIKYASLMVGIDEDTTCAVGQAFTPTTSATVDHWDQVDLQSYSVGTIDSTNGSITPKHDGRLLIRGLDANDEIVHVTYLQIGTGFDEEANLL